MYTVKVKEQYWHECKSGPDATFPVRHPDTNEIVRLSRHDVMKVSSTNIKKLENLFQYVLDVKLEEEKVSFNLGNVMNKLDKTSANKVAEAAAQAQIESDKTSVSGETVSDRVKRLSGDGMSIDEIATEINMPAGFVKAMLSAN